MFSAAILAGGRATRFDGVDKGALVVDGAPILERQLAMLAGVAGVEDVLVVGPRDAAAGDAHGNARAIRDRFEGCGPLGGIHAALVDARHDAVLVLACDMPYVTAPLAAYLLALAAEDELVIPRAAGRYHPLCAVYRRACVDPIARRLGAGQLKIADLVEDVRTRVVTDAELERFGDYHRLLSNVNTPLDYAALQGSTGHEL
jgi:molybdopterin-guanine dinucleotide biosynthesis protein A